MLMASEEKYLKKLGKHIANLREKKNLSQYRMAKELLTEQSNYARIEDGTTNPTVKTLLKICEVLECEMKEIFEF